MRSNEWYIKMKWKLLMNWSLSILLSIINELFNHFDLTKQKKIGALNNSHLIQYLINSELGVGMVDLKIDLSNILEVDLLIFKEKYFKS